MSQLGLGVMINALCGNSGENPQKYYGKKISGAVKTSDEFLIVFEDGSKIKILDDGQSCCESRYMTCEDDPNRLAGGILTSIETKEAMAPPGGDGEHEIVFVDIKTDKDTIQLATHNEHNGYYGGFSLVVKEVK